MELLHEHCGCGCEHDENNVNGGVGGPSMSGSEGELLSKYEQALSLYDTRVDEAAVSRRVSGLLEGHLGECDSVEVKRFLLNSVELTSLGVTDSEDSVLGMVERVNAFDDRFAELGHVATVCVWPNMAHVCHDALENGEVGIACVCGGFPSGQTFSEVRIAETALAVRDGASEVDMVMPVGRFVVGDYEGVADEIGEVKAVCGERPLKVILETGALGSLSAVKRAALVAMYAGADFVKTSTGKIAVGATPEAGLVMCEAVREYWERTGRRVGFKAAGGLRSVRDALSYYVIVREVLGEGWLTNGLFRLGTSRLANLLLSDIVGKEVKWF